MSVDLDQEFEQILHARQLKMVFQPILHLDSGARVGYEALVRGPAGSRFETASSLLAEAYRTGRVVEFDWVARASACRAAMAAGVDPGQMLFLNIEPLAMGSPCPPDLWPDIEAAFDAYQVMLEVTERSLARDPKSLLEGIDHQRPAVAGIAIDDLGAASTALSMLPVLASDVIKLDLSVTQAGPSPAIMKVLDIAYEEAERVGATILAEGIETAEHAAFARATGATLGQGRYFGEPGPLPGPRSRAAPTWSVGAQPIPNLPTPFDALGDRPTTVASAELLVPLSRQIAFRGMRLAEPAMLLVVVPDPRLLAPTDRRRLADLARRGVMVAALGPGLPTPPAPDVRGGPTEPGDLDGQWAVVALGPGTASAMLARRRPGSATGFDFSVTHDRRRTVAAARSLLRRLGSA